MTHHLKTRIVLANTAHAKWVERDAGHFVILSEIAGDKATASHHTATVHQSGSPVRHAAGREDLTDKSRQQFGHEIADRLNEEAERGEYQRLALVAPAPLLAAIRERLSVKARDKLVHELAKDLTKTPVAELGEWLLSPAFG